MADLTTEVCLITSPRKLQEMALPTAEGHDVTTASGVSMKQYEEQLNGLRKENFHLKLRIYFLEEKLGTGSPPAVQGLLEHNVRLQVEVEELRRQLTDKQELLAAAAEAIDVLEQQGSISTDSVELSLNNSTVMKKEITSQVQVSEKKEPVDDTCAESESAGDYLAVTVNNDELDELVKLRRENRKALQMIKGCMKKIQQQDKEIKKIKLDKELVYAHVSDSQLEKYEEILKCKDEHIKDLESKVRDLQKHFEKIENVDAAGNLQQLLTRRLQGLAYFLDKLLSHKCVLGEDKKKLAESILEQSLALPVGLELDESMAPEELTMDESNLDISQSLRIEDLTMMFGHHGMCSDDNNRYSINRKALLKHFPQADVISESECWSEPDRNVSLARVGLCDTGVGARESSSDNSKYRTRRARVSYGSRSDKTSPETLIEELNHLTKRSEHLEEENNDLNGKLEFSKEQINELITENHELKEHLLSEETKLTEATKDIETLRNTIVTLENRIKDIEQKLTDAAQTTERLRAERQELEATFMETERSLRRAADEATVQASQAALERARAQHDRLRLERELEETREKLSSALEVNSQLEIEVTRKTAVEANNKIAIVHENLSEEDRPTSPDQGIDSDRLSSLEHNDAVALSPRSLYEENVTLKQKLARTKATLAETLMQLNAANLRKRSVQRAICREIHKTQGVLRKARDQFENQSNN
ncbi:uncharacterized protein LOC142987336 isoform X2 [Anticarsia gemmatalis]|uniref:uncharacterized protein LOC142987336 isoform X2 n=1 Tax=Anticarsia gemmatalis TaxID=129554 RepID=UPI003F76B54D